MERQPKLLVVDDEQPLRGLVADFLRRSHYLVDEAGDRAEAIEHFRSHRPYDVVMMDLNLPGPSGIDISAEIRQIDPAQPILIVSAAILPEHSEVLDALGAIDILTKPYLPQELLTRLRWVGRRTGGGVRRMGPHVVPPAVAAVGTAPLVIRSTVD